MLPKSPYTSNNKPIEIPEQFLRDIKDMLAQPESTLPTRSLERGLVEYDPIDRLLTELPKTGQAIAQRHCETLDKKYPGPEHTEVKSVIRRLAIRPHDILAHEPKWHQWSIPEHTTNVVRVAFSLLIDNLNDQSEAVRKSVEHLQEQMIDGISLFKLFLISIPLHDIGKYQPIIKPADQKEGIRSGHTGHEARSGDIIRQLSRYDCPEELLVLKNIFNESQINANHLGFIEQCARLHYEFGKVREIAKQSAGGYNLTFVSSDEFAHACKTIADEHSFELGIIKGLYFLVDNAGKLDSAVTSEYMALLEKNPEHADEKLDLLMVVKSMPRSLKSAVQQFPVNNAVAQEYLKNLFTGRGAKKS